MKSSGHCNYIDLLGELGIFSPISWAEYFRSLVRAFPSGFTTKRQPEKEQIHFFIVSAKLFKIEFFSELNGTLGHSY